MRAAAGRIRNKFGPALWQAALVANLIEYLRDFRVVARLRAGGGREYSNAAHPRTLSLAASRLRRQQQQGYGLIIVIGCQASLHRQLNPIENVPVASAAGSFHHHAHFLYAGLLSSLEYFVVAPQYLACAAQVSLLPSAFKSR